jgi:hypothetical protein
LKIPSTKFQIPNKFQKTKSHKRLVINATVFCEFLCFGDFVAIKGFSEGTQTFNCTIGISKKIPGHQYYFQDEQISLRKYLYINIIEKGVKPDHPNLF